MCEAAFHSRWATARKYRKIYLGYRRAVAALCYCSNAPISLKKQTNATIAIKITTADFPLPMEDPVACVYNLVTTFSANVKDYVVGSPASTDLVQANRDTYQAFKFAIRASAPPFAPYKNERDAPSDLNQYVRTNGNDGDAPPGTIMYLEDVKAHLKACVFSVPKRSPLLMAYPVVL